MKIKYKLFALLLSIVLGFNSFSIITSYADTQNSVIQNQTENIEIDFTDDQLNIIEAGLTPHNIKIIDGLVKEIDFQAPRRFKRSPQTQVVKKSIKIALKNRNKIINLVGRSIGKDAAVSVGAAFNTISPVLNKLLTWQDLAYGTVQGQITNALINSGMPATTARTVALWVRLALEWVA